MGGGGGGLLKRRERDRERERERERGGGRRVDLAEANASGLHRVDTGHGQCKNKDVQVWRIHSETNMEMGQTYSKNEGQ